MRECILLAARCTVCIGKFKSTVTEAIISSAQNIKKTWPKVSRTSLRK